MSYLFFFYGKKIVVLPSNMRKELKYMTHCKSKTFVSTYEFVSMISRMNKTNKNTRLSVDVFKLHPPRAPEGLVICIS